MFRKLTAALVLGILATAPVVQAQTITPTQSPAPMTPQAPVISMDDARRVAAQHGVVRIEEIELDDGVWEIEGRDSIGGEIELDLRASDGVVVKIERDRPAAASARP